MANALDFFSLPMSAGPRDIAVGMDELGRPVRRTVLGREYRQAPPASAEVQGPPPPPKRNVFVRALMPAGNWNALFQGAMEGVTAPGRAARGEPVTYGDVAATALDWGVMAAPVGAATMPDNALGIFAGRNARTADTGALARAEDMARAGASRTVYRGTNNSGERIAGGIAEGDLFVTPYEDVARLYGDQIASYQLPETARVLVEGTPEFARVTGRRRGPLLRTMRQGENLRDAATSAAEAARAAGYDAVEFNSMRDMGIAVLNPNVLMQTERVTPAQEVARLLREGRASEVTDDMMAAVDPQEMYRLYESGATGMDMPMDEASRMARAREMGFDAEAPLYHGSRSARDLSASGAFDDARLGEYTGAQSAELGHFTASDPYIAATYADATPAQIADEYRSVFSSRNAPETLEGLREAYEFDIAPTLEVRPFKADYDGGDGFEWVLTERDEMFGDAFENVSDDVFGSADEALADGQRYIDGELARYDRRIEDAYAARQAGIEKLSDGSGSFPLFGRAENMGFEDFRGAGYGDRNFTDAIGGLLEDGHDAVTLEHVADAYTGGDYVADVSIFPNANQLRSRFARFDPRLKHLANLSAGVGAVGVGSLATQPAEAGTPEIQKYLDRYGPETTAAMLGVSVDDMNARFGPR